MLKLNYEYFLHPRKDNNLSLSTTESRIADAVSFLNNGEVIEFEDGIQVSSESELKNALLLHSIALQNVGDVTPPSQNKTDGEVNHKENPDKKIRNYAWIMVAVILCVICSSFAVLALIPQSGSDGYEMTTSSYDYYDEYKSIHSALNDHSVHLGMTYDEIKEICGPAEYTSRSNGVVVYAYYGNVQLCFYGGELYKYNEN